MEWDHGSLACLDCCRSALQSTAFQDLVPYGFHKYVFASTTKKSTLTPFNRYGTGVYLKPFRGHPSGSTASQMLIQYRLSLPLPEQICHHQRLHEKTTPTISSPSMAPWAWPGCLVDPAHADLHARPAYRYDTRRQGLRSGRMDCAAW